jgi:hypothetical protein
MKKTLQNLKDKYKINLSDRVFEYAINVELEHGTRFGEKTNVTNNNLDTTIKIVMAHLQEFPDYYQRLKRMEKEAEKYWKAKLKRQSRKRASKK